MTAWTNFNKEVEKLAQEAAVSIKDKVEAGKIGSVDVKQLRESLADSVNTFYSALFEQLKKGYDPGNFDLTAAIKDLTVSMFEVMSAGGAKAVAKSIVEKKGRELAVDIGKRIAGFDTPTADFKSPMARTVDSTTAILGDNAIGRTLGRVFGLFDELFSPNKAKEEYRKIDALLEMSKSQALKSIGDTLLPLENRAFDVGQAGRERAIQKSGFKEILDEKLFRFLEVFKQKPELLTAMKQVVAEKNLKPDFFMNLIKRTKAYINSPTEEESAFITARGDAARTRTLSIPQRLQKAGLFDDWKKVLNFMLYEPAFLDKPSLAPFVKTTMQKEKKAGVGFVDVERRSLDLSKLFGFDTEKDFLWTSNWSVI